MRKVFREQPRNERQIVNELIGLAERYEANFLDGWTIEFVEWPHGYCNSSRKVISIPSIAYMLHISGDHSDISWEKYWSTPVHELAHAFNDAWFGETVNAVGHSYTFYSILIALCMHLDLPFWSFEDYEKDYHPVKWRQGKSLAADSILDRMRRIGHDEDGDCVGRTIYAADYCLPHLSDSPCSQHIDESSSPTPEPKKGATK